MRYRALSEDGDYTFGQGRLNFLVDLPATVAQAVKTRLLLLFGEWFLDTTDGTPYSTQVLGTNTRATYDQAIRQRVLETEGVTEIVSYSSAVDGDSRKLTVTMTINTIFGQTQVTQVL